MTKFITAYGPKTLSKLDFIDSDGNPLPGAEQLTGQCHKELCDVTNIIRQYDRNGLITHVNQATAKYGDFTNVNEFQVSLNLVNDANAAFLAIPSQIRKKFENDAGKFFEFATNPENKEALIEMGLAEAPPSAPEPIMVKMAESAPAEESA